MKNRKYDIEERLIDFSIFVTGIKTAEKNKASKK